MNIFEMKIWCWIVINILTQDQRLRQHEDAMKAQRETEERVAATTLLTGYIAELLPAVLEGLKMSGFLLDEIKAGL